MTNNPLFSVLIAQYNNGKYLQEAIDSVKVQTYTNWEIILVDDASSDISHELYKLYEDDEQIKIYYNEENKGCGYTKRFCAELATGNICGFLDPDDVLLPNALQSMVNAHNTNPDVVLVFSRYYRCDENLNIKEESRLLIIPDGKTYFTNRDYRPEVFASFKKESYDKTEGLSPLYGAGVDQDLYFKLEEVGNVYVLNEFTYKWRRHSSSISSNEDKTSFWNLIVRYETCLRRGYDVNEYALLDYMAEIESYRRVRKSKRYRLGCLILKPFKIIKNLFKK